MKTHAHVNEVLDDQAKIHKLQSELNLHKTENSELLKKLQELASQKDPSNDVDSLMVGG